MKEVKFSKKLKIISIALVFALVLQLAPITVFATDVDISNLSESSESVTYPEVLYEDTSRREENVKHFKMNNGTYTAVEYSSPVHYMDSEGEYKDIDNTLESVTLADGTSAYINKDNSFSVTFPDDLSNNREIVVSKNGKKISFAVDGAGSSKGSVNNNTAAQKAEKLQKELQKATSEEERAEIRNKYAYGIENTESKLTYAYNGYIDVEYKLVGNKLKESLIIKKQTGKADFKFKYDLDGMTAELQPDNSVLVKDGDEVVFVIEAPYMFDAAENYSNNITVEIKNKNKGFEYILHADKNWLKSSDRVFPVTVDPTISGEITYKDDSATQLYESETRSASGAESGLDDSDENTMAQYYTTLKVGYVYGANVKSLYYAPIPSSIPKSARITNAVVKITAYRAPTTQFPVYISAITDTWGEDGDKSLAGTSQMPTYSSVKKNYTATVTAGTEYTFDITNVVQSWHAGELANNGIILYTDSAGTSSENFCAFYSTYAESIIHRPYYVYTYADTKGVEGYWSYSTVGLPKGGAASINQFTGYVSAEIPLLATESALLPFGLTLVYDGHSANTNTYSLSTCGLGMKLNIDQRIVPIDSGTPEYTAGYYYMYRDSDGTDIYLKRSYEGSVSHDKDELGYGYDGIITNGWDFYDRNDNMIHFNSSGCITSMYSASAEASVTVTYDPNNQYRIHKITDGTGNNLTITRNSAWYVTSIADDYGRYVNFTYDSGNHLTMLTYYDGTVVNFTYDADGMLTTVTGSDNTGIRFDYFDYPSTDARYYLTNRVSEVNEFYLENGTETEGNSISFTYNSGNSTTITDTNGDDTTFVFDSFGRCTSAFNDYGASSVIRPDATNKISQITTSSAVSKPIDNLLTNTSFENGSTGWILPSGASVVTSDYMLGYKSMQIVGNVDSYRNIRQLLYVDEPGEYTLSVYYKTLGTRTTGGLYVTVDGDGISTSGGTSKYISTDGEWLRADYTCVVGDATKQIVISIANAFSDCTILLDCVQFEKGNTANDYNLVENSGFSNGLAGWDTTWVHSNSSVVKYYDTTDANYDSTAPEALRYGYRMYGAYNYRYSATQSIKINKPASEVAVAFSVYTKAYSVYTDKDPSYTMGDPFFGTWVKIVYSDGTTEHKYKYFNSDTTSWQYCSDVFVPSIENQSKTVDYICFYLQYYYNCNYVDYSNVCVRFDRSGTSYTYDDNGNLVSATTLYNGETATNAFDAASNELTGTTDSVNGSWEYNYSQDNQHLLESIVQEELELLVEYSYADNLLIGTTLGSTKEGGTNKTISSSTEYTDDKNHVESITDAAGNTVTYTYDSMGRVSTVTSGNSKTTYSYYEGIDRVKSIISDTGIETSASVFYTYDTAGRLSAITRGNTVYTIEYDEWGNQKSVKVGNTALSTNTYEQGNGNLISTQYGNGTTVKFFYDELDRLIGKSYNDNGNTPNTFTQTYDADGRVSVYNDLVSNRKYKYSYDLAGRIAEISQGNNRFVYSYNSVNQLEKLQYTINGATRSTNYTYNVLGIPNTTTFNGAVKSRTLDDLGRITSQKITTRSNTDILTSYIYKDIDSTKTTNIINSVTNPFGTYNYTYDSLGNVIGISGAENKTYTYDYLGQLVGESGGGVNYTVTYDAFGNITNKNGKQYLYDTQNGWGDLLVSYDGDTITYDAIGNPTTYRNMAMAWQNGRQLATLTKDGTTYSYAYDSSGIRYQKIVGDKTYTFTYIDGNLVYQTDGTNVWWFYYDSDGTIMAMEYNGTTYYYVTDGIGNIVGLVDTNGNTVATYTYDAWGKLISATGDMANINPIRYKSYYFDSETGFYYLMSRYYDPEVGRFVNADGYYSTSVGVLGYNMLSYCNNSPIILEDSNGNIPRLIFERDGISVPVMPRKGPRSDVGAAKPYVAVPESNEPGINCYAYAIGYDKLIDPGFTNGYVAYSCKSIEMFTIYIMEDLINLGYTVRILLGPNSKVYSNEFKIAFRMGPQFKDHFVMSALDYNYHFMVQTASGQWAEKDGQYKGSVLHPAGVTPDDIKWEFNGEPYYYEYTVYLAVGIKGGKK